jgi:hypothetical protein
MWKNIVEPDTSQMTMWQTRIACWKTKATDSHSEYVIYIAFHCNNGYATRLYVTVLRTLPVLSLCFDRQLIMFDFILSPNGDHLFLVVQVQ